MPIVGRLVAVTFVLSVVAAAGASGQTHRPDQRRAYVGLNIGRLFEASEGVTGNATTWTVVIGYDFNNRWGLRSELGGAVEICDPGDHRRSHASLLSQSRGPVGRTSVLELKGRWAVTWRTGRG